MGAPAEVQAVPGELVVLAAAPGSRAGPATYARQDTSPFLSELSRQIWDLPDGKIIFASVIVCVWGWGWRAKAGRSGDRLIPLKHTRAPPLPSVCRRPDPSRGCGRPRAAPRRAAGRVPAAAALRGRPSSASADPAPGPRREESREGDEGSSLRGEKGGVGELGVNRARRAG